MTKEVSIGEALTVKPVAAALISIRLTPASSRPPLCTPSGASRKTGCGRYLFLAADGYLLRCFDSGTDPIRSFDGGRVGVWGRAAQSRANVLDNLRNYERLCGQRIPQTLSLVRFLCGHKK